MNDLPVPAVTQALALLRAPRGPRPDRDDRLPEGVLTLIRIVAGEEEALAHAAASTGESLPTIREAANFFIQQVMFSPGGNSFRVMGVDPDASDERIREHYRWLARWLHPDRNPDKWDAIYAERVNQAWQDLRTQERRQRYGETVQRPAVAEPVGRREGSPGARLPLAAEAATTQVNLRWLPSAILVGLGLSVLGLVALLYVQHLPGSSQEYAKIEPEPVDSPVVSARQPEAAPPVEAAVSKRLLPIEPASLQPSAVRSVPLPRVVQVVTMPPLQTVPEPARQALAATPAARPPPLPVQGRPKKALLTVGKYSRTVAAADAPRKPVGHGTGPGPGSEPMAVGALVSSAVASVEHENEPEAASPRRRLPIQTRDANRLMMRFSRAYEAGDLATMRGMFAADATSARGNLDSILNDYDKMFRSSNARSLNVRDISWFMSGDTLTILASFQATVSGGRKNRPRKSHGDIRFDLRRLDDKWQIYRLTHAERPG